MARKNRKRKNKNKYKQHDNDNVQVYYAPRPKSQHRPGKQQHIDNLALIFGGGQDNVKTKKYKGPDHIPLSAKTSNALSEFLKPKKAVVLPQHKHDIERWENEGGEL